jgi:glucose dehydrogenase
MEPRLHIPGLAGLSQGPGFANLGSLGLLANRVLSPLVPVLTRAKRAAAAAALTLLVIALLAGCGGGGSTSSASAPSDPEGGSASAAAGSEVAYPGIDLANSRFATGPIDRSSAETLQLAWTLPSETQSTYGAYSASPVVSGGVVYMQDLESNVQAVDLESGELLWETKMESPDQGPNGVAVAAGMVFGATATQAFALDAETGEELWSTELTTLPKEAIDMPPGVHDGLVYVSTVPTDVTSAYNGGIAGVLWALDAKTGAKKWSFDTAPKGLWSKRHKTINAGGGLWYAPSFDEEGGMYIGTGNPVPFPAPKACPGGRAAPVPTSTPTRW